MTALYLNLQVTAYSLVKKKTNLDLKKKPLQIELLLPHHSNQSLLSTMTAHSFICNLQVIAYILV